MAELHHHDTVERETIVDRTGPGGALAVLAIAALVGFLIWLFAFSGLVFNRSSSTTVTNNKTVTNNTTETNGGGSQSSTQPNAPANPS